MPELWGAVLRLEPDADRLSRLPGRLSGDPAAIEEDEEIVDLGDDAPEIPAGDDDNAFLEEEEEGEADVTGIVGTPGEET